MFVFASLPQAPRPPVTQITILSLAAVSSFFACLLFFNKMSCLAPLTRSQRLLAKHTDWVFFLLSINRNCIYPPPPEALASTYNVLCSYQLCTESDRKLGLWLGVQQCSGPGPCDKTQVGRPGLRYLILSRDAPAHTARLPTQHDSLLPRFITLCASMRHDRLFRYATRRDRESA